MRLALTFLIAFVISYLIVANTDGAYLKVIDLNFLFTFIGVLLGFSLSLFTHIASILIQYSSEVKKVTLDNPLKEKIIQDNDININNIFKEIESNIMFIFISLLLVILISILPTSLCNYIENYNKDILFISKVKDIILISIFLLNIYCVKDLISAAFGLTKFAATKKSNL